MFQSDQTEKSLFPPASPVASYLKTQNIVILFPELLIRNDIKCRQEETKNKKIAKCLQGALPKSSRIFFNLVESPWL